MVDLAAMQNFDVVPEGNKLVLKMRDGSSARPALPAANTEVAATPAAPASSSQKPVALASASSPVQNEVKTASPAQNLVIVNPTFAPKKEIAEDQKPEQKVVEATQSKADVAASRFSHQATSVASANQAPFQTSAKLGAPVSAINAALMQQQAAPTQIATTAVSTCTTGHYNGEPIGMNFKDLDLKDFFRVIHEISGLNVVPGSRRKRLRNHRA